MVTKTSVLILLVLLASSSKTQDATQLRKIGSNSPTFLEIKTKQTVGGGEFIEEDGFEDGDLGYLPEVVEDEGLLDDDNGPQPTGTQIDDEPVYFIGQEDPSLPEVLPTADPDEVYEVLPVYEEAEQDAEPEEADELQDPIPLIEEVLDLGNPADEEECDCIDGANCLQEVEVAIQCIDGECTVELLTETDIDFNADLVLRAFPVEDNGHCCE